MKALKPRKAKFLFRCVYSARPNNAHGIFWPQIVEVEADNKAEAEELGWVAIHHTHEVHHLITIDLVRSLLKGGA